MNVLPAHRRVWLLRGICAQLRRLIPDPYRRSKIIALVNEEIVEAGGKPEAEQ